MRASPEGVDVSAVNRLTTPAANSVNANIAAVRQRFNIPDKFRIVAVDGPNTVTVNLSSPGSRPTVGGAEKRTLTINEEDIINVPGASPHTREEIPEILEAIHGQVAAYDWDAIAGYESRRA
jgi:hypothetical protein